MNLTALVATKEQFEAALDSGVSEILFETAFFPVSEWPMIAKIAHEAGKAVFPALPEVFRTEAVKFFTENENAFKAANFDGYLARNTEGHFFMRERGIDLPAVSDHHCYVWNRESAKVLFSAGFSKITLGVELSREELKAVSDPRTEIVVYGRLPMMVTANCLKKTFASCDRKGDPLLLEDRDHRKMSVIRQCRFCQNVILNSVPLDLSDRMRDLNSLNPGAIRLNFTTEDRMETRSVLNRFTEALLHPELAAKPEGAFTRGAFLRGTQ